MQESFLYHFFIFMILYPWWNHSCKKLPLNSIVQLTIDFSSFNDTWILVQCRSPNFLWYQFSKKSTLYILRWLLIVSFSDCCWTIIYIWTFYNSNSPKKSTLYILSWLSNIGMIFILFNFGDYFWLRTMNDCGLSMMIGHKLPLLKRLAF